MTDSTEADRIAKLEQQLADVTLRLSQVGRWDLKSLAQMAAFAVAIVGSVYAIAVAPIRRDFAARSQLDIARHQQMEGRVAELWQREYGQPMSRTTEYHVIGEGGK